jgi:hypothetical protein
MRHPTLRNIPTLERAFQKLRNSDSHVGMGSIVLTFDEQSIICNIAKTQIFNTSIRCEQLVAFCKWIVKEKKGKIKSGTEEEIVWEWANAPH